MFDKLNKMVNKLEREFQHYADVLENGTSDPFSTDGLSLFLIRNHIIYYKKEICDYCAANSLSLPEICARDIPEKADFFYMAKPEKIRANAIKTLERFENDANLKFIRGINPERIRKDLRMAFDCISGCNEVLQDAILKDDLVVQRRYARNFGAYEIKMAYALADKIRNMEAEMFDPPKKDQQSLL